jgi:serine/threonine protein kinase
MDLYAVGVMPFELFTGRLPFIADSVVAMLMAHQSEQPPRPSSINLGLPDGVDEMVLKLGLSGRWSGQASPKPKRPWVTSSPVALRQHTARRPDR